MNRISAIAAVAAVGLAGCGDGGGGQRTQPTTTAAQTTAAKPAQTVALGATEFKFNPSKLNVKAGEVTFKVSNTGGVPHALEVEGNGVKAETDTIQPGGNAELKVNVKADTYEFYCPVGDHKQRGMVGELTVK